MSAKPTILVVDDAEASRYTLTRMLQKAQYTVKEAGTGADALRLAAERPDLIILDINLPDLSGHEVRRRLKGDPATSAIPVLHLSASFVETENRVEGLEGGADGYLTYPVEPRELIANVEALLRTRRAEREARAQQELLQVTLNSIGDAVIATDAAGRVTFLNPVAQALTGWSVSEGVGKPLTDVLRIVDKQSRQPLENPAQKALREGKVVAMANHSVLIARDGSERPIEDSAAPIRDSDGRVHGVVLVFRDVTQRQAAEDALRHSQHELAERDRRKDEFLAMLAHELRNPLAPMRNALHLVDMADPDPKPGVREARALMERQLEHLVRLVDDLMDISRITRGRIDLHKERVDLATVVARAVEGSRPLIDARRHALEMTLPDCPLPVDVDSVRMAQVFWNLLTNAAKYTPTGGRIRLTVEKVASLAPTPSAAGAGDVEVKVSDTGVGIAADNLPRVFDLFTQVERSLDRAEGGLGIGLTLVHRLTEMHGGRVSAASEGLGRGSQFVVRLPLAPAAQSDEPPAPRSTQAGRTALAARRVLVVDDNRDSAESLAMLLRLMGSDVRTAYDGRLALETATTYRPEIVLLDIGLPGMDGLEVCNRLRQDESLGRPRIVAMTGYGQGEDKRRSHEAGFDAHLVKPVDLTTLLDLLGRIAQS
jgi:PAS domain S-box-containing protein